jgi:diketogulonate reductase-like aldo/keto reductase
MTPTTSVASDILPAFIYGTAWKEEETERLVRLALQAGFRGIDTANQRRHYHEAGVGAAIAAAISDGTVHRAELFLQTKFTSVDGQDQRLPYEKSAAVGTQVTQSFASSLEHLGVEWIDSYVLHGPSRRHGLAATDLEAWQAMEDLHRSRKTSRLGISNVALDQLEELWERARVRPAFVQNRCFAATGWDRDVRTFCGNRGIVYQGFSLLTANGNELRHPSFRRIVERTKRTVAQVVFRFARQAGMLPLTGTTDPNHMREDLGIDGFELTEEDVRMIENVAIES